MLQPESQTILETLQPLVEPEMGWLLRLPYHEDGGTLYPFVWDGSEQGEFRLWSLLQAEGWSQTTTLNAALENWSLPDRTGTVNGETGLLPSSDQAGILLDAATQKARLALYQALLDWLEANLQNLTAFRLSCTSEQDADPYVAVIVVGQAADVWLSVAPSIPHATPERSFPFQAGAVPVSSQSAVSQLEPQLQISLEQKLNQLGVIRVYGYYGGGYDQMHDHKLVYATGISQTAALEQVLHIAGAIETKTFDHFQPKVDADAEAKPIEALDHVLHQAFSHLRLDRICFWNREHFYISGECHTDEQASDRVGVVLRSRFTYNP
jgi:hypothetical protein